MLASENVQKQNLQNLMYHDMGSMKISTSKITCMYTVRMYVHTCIYIHDVLAYMYMYERMDGNRDQILREQYGLKATINNYIHRHLKLTPTM